MSDPEEERDHANFIIAVIAGMIFFVAFMALAKTYKVNVVKPTAECQGLPGACTHADPPPAPITIAPYFGGAGQ